MFTVPRLSISLKTTSLTLTLDSLYDHYHSHLLHFKFYKSKEELQNVRGDLDIWLFYGQYILYELLINNWF